MSPVKVVKKITGSGLSSSQLWQIVFGTEIRIFFGTEIRILTIAEFELGLSKSEFEVGFLGRAGAQVARVRSWKFGVEKV